MTKPAIPETNKEFIDYRFNETIKSIEDVKKDVKAVSEKLDTSFATKDYVDGKAKNLEERVLSLESDRSWAIRLIIGFVVMGILYAVVRFKG